MTDDLETLSRQDDDVIYTGKIIPYVTDRPVTDGIPFGILENETLKGHFCISGMMETINRANIGLPSLAARTYHVASQPLGVAT